MCKCGYFAHERKIHVTGPLYGYVFGNYQTMLTQDCFLIANWPPFPQRTLCNNLQLLTLRGKCK